jgi:hypothetical protein
MAVLPLCSVQARQVVFGLAGRSAPVAGSPALGSTTAGSPLDPLEGTVADQEPSRLEEDGPTVGGEEEAGRNSWRRSPPPPSRYR